MHAGQAFGSSNPKRTWRSRECRTSRSTSRDNALRPLRVRGHENGIGGDGGQRFTVAAAGKITKQDNGQQRIVQRYGNRDGKPQRDNGQASGFLGTPRECVLVRHLRVAAPRICTLRGTHRAPSEINASRPVPGIPLMSAKRPMVHDHAKRAFNISLETDKIPLEDDNQWWGLRFRRRSLLTISGHAWTGIFLTSSMRRIPPSPKCARAAEIPSDRLPDYAAARQHEQPPPRFPGLPLQRTGKFTLRSVHG